MDSQGPEEAAELRGRQTAGGDAATRPYQMLLVFGVASFLAVCGLAFLLVVYVFTGNTEDQLARQRIERLGRFNFPERTGQVFSTYDADSATLWVRFSMPAAQWRAFVESTDVLNFETVEQLPPAFDRTPPDADWWLPALPANARLGTADTPEYQQTILADFAESGRPTAYVIVVEK